MSAAPTVATAAATARSAPGVAPWRWPLAAGATWLGALVAVPLPLLVPVAVAASALAARRRRPLVFVLLACTCLATAASSRAAGFEDAVSVEARRLAGEVVVREDPERFGAAVRLVVEADGTAIEAWARGRAARELSERAVGERVVLAGDVAPMEAPWRLRQGVVGRMEVESVGAWRPGGLVSRSANGLRRTLAGGARAMEPDDAALYLGLVLGDTRGIDVVTEDAFAGSGLTHIMAVSGSNVASVLVLVGPLTRRCRLGWRLAVTLGVLLLFAVVTRLEPSVLRASTMAAIGATAVTVGSPAESRRLLATTVLVLLLVDPSLATSVGFQLSVAASAGILLLARRLADAVPGPRALIEPLAVTLAAQLAVAPLLLPLAGGIPVASLPANLLAGPVAGLVVVWGVPAGLVAGALGGGSILSRLLHLPTAWMVSWVAWVAELAARSPLGELGPVHVAALGAVVLAGSALPSARRSHWLLTCAVLVLLHPSVALASGHGPPASLGPGAVLHRAGGAVVLELGPSVRPGDLLSGLRRAGVRRVDVVVGRDGGRSVAEAVATVGQAVEVRAVLVPEGHRVPGGSVPPVGAVIGIGPLEIVVADVEPRLEVEVRRVASVTRARDPPRSPRAADARASERRAAAPRRWRSWRPPPRRRRRSCRSRRSTTTRRAVRPRR